MKKYVIYVIALLFAIMTITMTYFNVSLNTIMLASVVFFIGTFILLFEMRGIDSRKIAAIATLSALGGVLRVPFAAIPGLQPTTFIIAVAGYTLGPINGFMVGSMAAFISNFFLGHGPWTLWQMLAWGLCGVFFGAIRKSKGKREKIIFAILCGIWGYIFGLILDMWYIVAFVKPINMEAILIGFAGSFYFDTLHALGNLIFSLLLGRGFIETLERFNKRYTAEYIN